jgi:periplasmic divalent cation tolerance protein
MEYILQVGRIAMVDYIQVSTTVDNREDALKLSRRLVEARAAACVQVLGPAQSTYRWKGAVELSEEWLCLIKTEGRLFESVQRVVTETHPYEVPELIAMKVTAGSEDYLKWISQETTH